MSSHLGFLLVSIGCSPPHPSSASLIKQSHNLVESYIEANKVKAASQTRKLSTALGAWTAFCSNFAVNIPVFPIIPSVVTLFAVHITIVKTSVPTQQLQALEELRKITAPIWRSKLDAEATTTLFDLPVLKDFLGEYGISLGGPGESLDSPLQLALADSALGSPLQSLANSLQLHLELSSLRKLPQRLSRRGSPRCRALPRWCACLFKCRPPGAR